MDMNDLRSALTLAGLVLFLALLAWTWWPSRRTAHDEAGRLPFEGDDGFGAQGLPPGTETARRPTSPGGERR